MKPEPGTTGRAFLSEARNVVVKVGSAVLTDGKLLDRAVIADLCYQIAELRRQGRDVTMVSSGAVAAGKGKLSSRREARTVPEIQALAAVGQGRLMQAYEEAFDRFDLSVAQILVTREGLMARHRYLNAKNTLKTLLQWGIVPVVNENDTVATEELQFTDNDALSVLIVNLVEADVLVCLSDIDGLYDRDPREWPDARRVPEVVRVDRSVIESAASTPGRAGRGGMRSKLEAAQRVTSCGVPMVVARGRTPNVLQKVFSGADIGTVFHPRKRPKIYGRKPWIAFALAREGMIEIDRGAVKALLEQGKSLLPVGVRGVRGEFDAGSCVVCCDEQGEEVAVGLTAYSSQDLARIFGCQTGEIFERVGHHGSKEVIHRDNMVIL